MIESCCFATTRSHLLSRPVLTQESLLSLPRLTDKLSWYFYTQVLIQVISAPLALV